MKNNGHKPPQPAARRRVDFVLNESDYHAATLASIGFSDTVIEAQTGLTRSQIQYRLSTARARLGLEKIRRADYRNGVSTTAAFIMRTACSHVTRDIRAEVRALPKLVRK